MIDSIQDYANFACGEGQYIIMFRRMTKSKLYVYGFDICPKMIDKAKEQIKDSSIEYIV